MRRGKHAEGRRAGSAAPHPARTPSRSGCSTRDGNPDFYVKFYVLNRKGEYAGVALYAEHSARPETTAGHAKRRRSRRASPCARSRGLQNAAARRCSASSAAETLETRPSRRSARRASGWATAWSRRPCGSGTTRRWPAAAGAGDARLPQGGAVPAHGQLQAARGALTVMLDLSPGGAGPRRDRGQRGQPRDGGRLRGAARSAARPRW